MRLATMSLLLSAFVAASASAETKGFGAVDVGSKGTKASLFSFDSENPDDNPSVAFGDVINTKLVSTMKDGMFTKEGIEEAANAAKTLIERMRVQAKELKVAADHYYICGSSGVAMAKNTAELAEAVKKATGITMEFIDTKHEAFFGYMYAVPKSRRLTAAYLDIGSGNTKMGCLVGSEDLTSFKPASLPFGSVTLRNAGLEKSPTDVPAGILQVLHDTVYPAYQKASMDTPCLESRQRVYWSGGAAWATATFTHPEWVFDNWVIISKADLNGFLTHLKDKTWNQTALHINFPAKLSAPDMQKKIRERAEKDRADVQNVFAREDLIAGVSIMKTILDNSNPSAILQFVRTGDYIGGWSLEKYRAEADSPKSVAAKH